MDGGLFQVTVDAADIVLVRSDLRDLLVSCQRHPMTAVLPDGLSGSHYKLRTLNGKSMGCYVMDAVVVVVVVVVDGHLPQHL